MYALFNIVIKASIVKSGLIKKNNDKKRILRENKGDAQTQMFIKYIVDHRASICMYMN